MLADYHFHELTWRSHPSLIPLTSPTRVTQFHKVINELLVYFYGLFAYRFNGIKSKTESYVRWVFSFWTYGVNNVCWYYEVKKTHYSSNSRKSLRFFVGIQPFDGYDYHNWMALRHSITCNVCSLMSRDPRHWTEPEQVQNSAGSQCHGLDQDRMWGLG